MTETHGISITDSTIRIKDREERKTSLPYSSWRPSSLDTSSDVSVN